MSVLFIDGKPSGRRNFKNFTNVGDDSLPDFREHIDDIINVFKEHCNKRKKLYFAQSIQDYEEFSASYSHSHQNFKNFNRALEWAASNDIKWIYISCGCYGVSPTGEGMTEAQYRTELRKNDKWMRLLNRNEVKVYHPGSNEPEDIDYEKSYEWAPRLKHPNLKFVNHSECENYDYTSQETAMHLGLDVAKS